MSNNSTFLIGIDLGDKQSVVIILDQDGGAIKESRISTTKNSFNRKFMNLYSCRIAKEVGVHSRWASQTLKKLCFEVIKTNTCKLHRICENPRKVIEPMPNIRYDLHDSTSNHYHMSIINDERQ